MKGLIRNLTLLSVFLYALIGTSSAQSVTRELKLNKGGGITVVNLSGRVEARAAADATTVTLTATSASAIGENELKIDVSGNIRIEVSGPGAGKRVDIALVVPERVRLSVETRDGEVRVSGDLASIEVTTDTGTIAADIPLDDVRYDFFWTASRPRYLSDVELAKVKEKSGGKFQLKGRLGDLEKGKDREETAEPSSSDGGGLTVSAGDGINGVPAIPAEARSKKQKLAEDDKNKSRPRSTTVSLNFTTARGIVLLNIPPNEVTSDLRERPLTEAAEAIVRSGDVVLTDAIRRATPKYFGDYARTLPPARREPSLTASTRAADIPGDTVKEAVVRVTDAHNRALGELRTDDFAVTESGSPREILSIRPHTAPVNLVLLLDVSGSVDNYVNFIRKAARAFIDTARPEDRISVILFNEDVKVLSGFSTNRARLSESLDTFDAGGATAYYDALAYTLADTLRPLRGERTAIVVLTDGDDNRSFLPFESLIGAIEESGALIYPLYVPSALIAASETNDPEKGIDPLRNRYMTLSARAEGEGERLAKVSGGVYYPITQLSQIQKAYDDIVQQIRTAYAVTFRSGYRADPDNRPSPRLKIRVNKPNAFVQVSSVTAR